MSVLAPQEHHKNIQQIDLIAQLHHKNDFRGFRYKKRSIYLQSNNRCTRDYTSVSAGCIFGWV